MYDGSHREQLEYVPTDSRGKPLTSWSVGTCSGCGLVRRYSTSYAKNARAKASHEEVKNARRRDVSLIAEVKREDGRAWDVVLDGLLHTGGGRWSLLERLAMHIEPTMLFVDEFARAMESLGHIDIRRDPQSLRPVEWEVAPAALSATPSGMLLSGQWTQAVTDEVARLVRDSGGQLVHYVQPDGPMSWFYAGVGDWRSADVERVTDYVTVQGDSWRDLAVTLPTLGSVVKALPRRRANIDGRATWFDVAQARWVDATDLRQPGAYRVHTFSTLDLVRTPEDLAQGTVAVSTVHLSKHVASMVLRGPPLLSYDRDSAELTLPLGADLPGLYGRAAVLASGFLPEQRGRQLVYSDIPLELAAHLAHLLTH